MVRSLKTLVVIVMLFLLTPVTSFSKVFLVSVGIADYPGTVNDLKLCARDARTITALYSKNQDMTYCQLIDSEATREKIEKAMNKVYAKAGENDIVVFFYSGHGYQGGFCAYDGQLPYTVIRKAMMKSKSRNKMIFADACFSGKFRTPGHSSNEVQEAKNSKVMVFLSSRGSETSIESASMNNGFFTSFLQKGLRGAADEDRNRVITAKELFNYVNSNVVRRTSGRQHPVMWGRFPDDMPVMIW